MSGTAARMTSKNGLRGADVKRIPEANRRLLRGRILDELAESYPAFARLMAEAA